MKRPEKSILAELKDAKRKVVVKAVQADRGRDISEKIEWEKRRRHLDQLISSFQLRDDIRTAGRTVFVSYSSDTGTEYFETLCNLLAQKEFEVNTGFLKPPEKEDGSVLGRVLTQLRRSTLYCGIMTKELQIENKSGQHLWSPSVWTIEEKGMALALGKPIALLVEEGIHDNFWQKTVPHKLNIKFNEKTFVEKCSEIVDALVDRYTEIAVKHVQGGPSDLGTSSSKGTWGNTP